MLGLLLTESGGLQEQPPHLWSSSCRLRHFPGAPLSPERCSQGFLPQGAAESLRAENPLLQAVLQVNGTVLLPLLGEFSQITCN